MTMNIAVSPEYEVEKRHFHSNRLLLLLLQNKLTFSSYIYMYIFTYSGCAPDCLLSKWIIIKWSSSRDNMPLGFAIRLD